MDRNCCDPSDITGTARRPLTRDVCRYVGVFRGYGQKTFKRSCSLIFKTVGMTTALYNNDNLVQRKEEFFKQENYATQTISSPSNKRVFIAIHEEGFLTYIRKRLGCVRDFYIVEVTDNYSRTRSLDDNDQRKSTDCECCFML